MSNQGFGGDDDDNRSDIERLLDGVSSAKEWYEKNSDLFDRFLDTGGSVSLSGGEPISEAHVDEDKVLIIADVSGVTATDLELRFYDSMVEGKLGGREFSVDVPNDVDEDSIEADMKNGVLRVELDRVVDEGDNLTVDTVDKTDEEIGSDEDDFGDLDDVLGDIDDIRDDNDGGEE